jgi:hypothetical protein
MKQRSSTGMSLVFECESGERRSALRIDFEGECGHNWTLLLQQRKGKIFVTTRILGELPVEL